MGGTLLNIVTVIIGSTLGILLGNRLSARMQESVMMGIGLVTIVVGVQNANASGNIIIPLLAIVIGGIVGETLDVDGALQRFGTWLQKRYASTASADATTDEANDVEASGMDAKQRFITGFVTASLLFCVGPLTFVGAFQDGMGLAVGFQFLAIKSVLDGFASLALAASFGIGVLFTVLTILVVQGGLALLGYVAVTLMSETALLTSLENSPIILEMTAVGGVMLLGLAFMLLDIKRMRVANLLPALIVAPLLVILAQALNIPVYPL
jgi:uncharacterized membrane protein YqgA involved in biofilm formation